ncbi:MAG: hypothetical protein ACLUEJ_13730 [Clostridium sp.]
MYDRGRDDPKQCRGRFK